MVQSLVNTEGRAMHQVSQVSNTSLFFASSLILITLFFSYWQKLKLEKDTIISVLRAVVQLIAIGYVLEFIFGQKSVWFTSLLLLFMIINAAYNAARRGTGIKHGFLISCLAIGVGTIVTLTVLICSKTIHFSAYQVIPVSGMIIGNAMIALGLCYKQLLKDFQQKRNEIETKLALGADILPSAINLVRDALKTGTIPTLDSAKTLGIVSLPGMMTGLILAGASPLAAVKYQIMVTFMLLATTSIASFIACFLAYRGFFNAQKQLI
jgi:putative ABC transport system permease protein